MKSLLAQQFAQLPAVMLEARRQQQFRRVLKQLMLDQQRPEPKLKPMVEALRKIGATEA